MKIIFKMVATIMENILKQLESSNCNIYTFLKRDQNYIQNSCNN